MMNLLHKDGLTDKRTGSWTEHWSGGWTWTDRTTAWWIDRQSCGLPDVKTALGTDRQTGGQTDIITYCKL